MKKKRTVGKRMVMLLLMWLICGCLSSGQSVYAAALQQSEDVVSVTLRHEHARDICYESVWVPCGGIWRSYWEEYHMATVYTCSNAYSESYSNGVRLKDIHYGFYTTEHTGVHNGEYHTRQICTAQASAKFQITKETTEAGVVLRASLSENGILVGNYRISWDGGVNWTENQEASISISENAAYQAVLEWTDTLSGVVKTTKLTYTDTSFPIRLDFYSNEEIILTEYVTYGGSLPFIAIPERTGYLFGGYEKEGILFYDEEGNPKEEVSTDWEAMSISINALWEAKEYVVYYGTDEDEDGVPDESFFVVFGETYEPVEPLGNSGNRIFQGFYIGSDRVFDSKGNPTGVWRWDSSEEIILKPLYTVLPQNSNAGDNQEEEKDEDVPVTVPVMPEAEISQNEVSQNEVSENQISENSVSNNVPGTDENGGNTGLGGQDILVTEQEATPVPISFDEAILFRYKEDSGREESIENDENIEENVIEETISVNLALPPTTEQTGRVLQRQLTTMDVILIVGGVTAFLTVGIFTLFMIMSGGLAWTVVQEILPDGKTKKLGDSLVIRKKGRFQIAVGKHILMKSETGRLELIFAKKFAEKNKNQDIVIMMPNKVVADVITPVIRIIFKGFTGSR